MNRWFATIVNQPKVKSVLGEVTMCEKATEAGTGKKDNKKKEEKKKPAEKKEAAKPKAKEPEEEPAVAVEKPKVG